MAVHSYFLLSFLLVYFLLSFLLVLHSGFGINFGIAPSNINYDLANNTASFNRSSFPAGFIFGTASSAYQSEGTVKEGGRGPSIWDTFTHRYPYKIKDGSNGDIAIDSYHRYKEDVGIMKEMGLDAYRFSISWSRILPNGKLSGGVNREGITYYNNVINELLANGIQPYITLFHWDLPQALEDEYGGFLSPKIVNDFYDYAWICFKEFGDRVKYWITLNEPFAYSVGGYAMGLLAPGRCSDWQKANCTGGNSGIEPYIVTHNQLIAHAAVVSLYKKKFQATQKGKIGIAVVTVWYVPLSNIKQNQHAVKRGLDFMFGWFMEPLTNGEYPHRMRSLVGSRLPKFSKKQSKMLKGSFDFLARRNGISIGPMGTSTLINVYPRGIRDLLLYTKRKYNNPLIYILENGIDEFNNSTLTLKEALVDKARIEYFYHHLSFVKKAIQEGVNVKGYFAWSLLDSFEWNSGYTARFGFNYVDYKDGLKRYPKLSSHWFKRFLKKEN